MLQGVINQDGSLHKGIAKMASAMGLDVEVDLEQKQVWIFCEEVDDFCEPMCMYRLEDRGLFWQGNVYLPQSTSEEMPAWIPDRTKFVEVLRFIHSENPLSWHN